METIAARSSVRSGISPSRSRPTGCSPSWPLTSAARAIPLRSRFPYDVNSLGRKRAGAKLAALDAGGDLAQPRLERGVDLPHLQPHLRHHRFALADLGAAHALAPQRRKALPGGGLVPEDAERERPAVAAVVLDDEVVLHAEVFQLARLAGGGLPASLRRNEDPPRRMLFRLPGGESPAEREPREGRLCARRVGEGEAAPFEARGGACRSRRGLRPLRHLARRQDPQPVGIDLAAK